MKSNTTLTSQYNESEAEAERAAGTSKSNKQTQEELTSDDDDDDERPSPAPPATDKSLYSTNRMFGYSGNPTESIMSNETTLQFEQNIMNKTSSPPGPAPQRPNATPTRLLFDNSKRFY